MNKKKKIILLSIIVLIIIFIIVILTISNIKPPSIKVEYENGEVINIPNKNGNTLTKRITITNETDQVLYYNLNWENVKNTFKTQSNLLYSIEKQASSYREVGTSQVPIVSSPVFSQIRIKSKDVHVYKLKIWYQNSFEELESSKSKFTGVLAVEKLTKEEQNKIEENDSLSNSGAKPKN